MTFYEQAPGFVNKTLNLTKLIAENFADSLPNCFEFIESIYYWEKNRWIGFGSSTGLFLEAFLFNMMSKADNFLEYFDKTKKFMSAVNEFGEPAPKRELIW
jgi:hypothetical protein